MLLSPWQPPPNSLLYQLTSLKRTHVGKHTHNSYAIQSLAQAGLVCSTRPSEWYLESPCPAPISELLTRSVHVSLLGVVAISEACYWPELMASLPVQSLSRHLPYCPVTSALCGLQWPKVTQGCCSHAVKHRNRCINRTENLVDAMLFIRALKTTSS